MIKDETIDERAGLILKAVEGLSGFEAIGLLMTVVNYFSNDDKI